MALEEQRGAADDDQDDDGRVGDLEGFDAVAVRFAGATEGRAEDCHDSGRADRGDDATDSGDVDGDATAQHHAEEEDEQGDPVVEDGRVGWAPLQEAGDDDGDDPGADEYAEGGDQG